MIKVITIRKSVRNTIEYLSAAKGISVSHETKRPNMARVQRMLSNRSTT